MTKQVQNYFMGQWQDFSGEGILQRNAVNGSEISVVNGHDSVPFADILDYGRRVGNKALRKMTFLERGLMIKKLAFFLHKNRKKYYPISYQSGATKTDSWIDIDGGIGTLFAYASLRKQFPDDQLYVDGHVEGIEW